MSSLERHLSFEKCSKSLERQPLLDLAKTQYAAYLMEGVGVMPTLKSREHVITSETRFNIKEGWALKETRKAYRFNDTQKAYLETKFNIGQSTGRKMDPVVVAREMRRSVHSNGKRLFKASEFLTEQQISSFFSRLVAKRATVHPLDDDIQASQEEANYATARQEILSRLQVEHPIVYDQYNICAMVKNSTLKSLKLGLLQLLCENFELETPAPKLRKKAPYIALLEQMVSSCSCSGLSPK